MNTDVEFLTAEGQAKLKTELDQLISVRRREVAAMIKEAKEAGDISENAGYDEAKDQQAFLEGRIKYLEDVLKRSKVIENTNGADVISLGSLVTVAEDGEGPECFRIVGAVEADPAQGRISNESPLGRALLGKRKGDSALVKTPDGTPLKFAILKIE